MLVTTENSITKLDVNGTFIYTLDLDSEVYINGFDISPDASMFAVSFHKGGVRDGKIGVWDTETGNLIEEIVLENSFGGGVAFSPDGVFLACGESDGWETAQVKLYSTSDWNLYRSLSADSVIWKGFSWDPIILFSPNNSLLIWHYVDSDGTADASIKFWNGSDFSPVFKFYWEGSSLNDLKMSPDGTYLLAALGYGVRVYEIK